MAERMVIDIYPGEIERMTMPGGMVDDYCRDTSIKVAELAQTLAPQGDTGQLAQQIRSRREGLFWTVEAYAPYALYVHEGTKPHVIEAKNVKVLRFPSSGGMVTFAQKVNHPGTQGRPFLTEALTAVVSA